LAAANKCTSIAEHFDGHGGVPMRYEAHHPMKHDQGFTGSHWTPSLVNYSLRIAPAATRATANGTTMQNEPTLLVITMVMAMRWYYTARINQWRRFVAFIIATKRRHRVSSRSDVIKPDTPTPVDSYISSYKRARVDMLTPNNNRGVTYQTNEKHLTNLREYFVGVVLLACYAINTRLLLRVFNDHLLKYL